MPRKPRLDLPGIPQHVVQRGHNRHACFFSPADYRCYLVNLLEASKFWHCAIHAYVLMTNHIHLLVTPPKVGALANMMQMLGRRYVSYINATYRRSGTLWEGRYKACLVDSDDYLLTCYRYIELNPVRAVMVDAPEGYAWSSYHANALGHDDRILTPHPQYLALGATLPLRQEAYLALFSNVIGDDQLAEIRAYIQQQRALGTSKFQTQIAAMTGRSVKFKPPHRPRLKHSSQNGG